MAELGPRARAYLDAFAASFVAPTPGPIAVLLRPPPVVASTLGRVGWLAVPLAAAILLPVVTPVVLVAIDDDERAVAAASSRITPAVRIASARVSAARSPKRVAPRPAAAPDDPPTAARVAATAPVDPAPPRRLRPRPDPPATRAPADTLAREIAILDDARAALQQGDRARVRARLDDHAREFPHGVLAPERGRLEERLAARDDPR